MEWYGKMKFCEGRFLIEIDFLMKIDIYIYILKKEIYYILRYVL